MNVLDPFSDLIEAIGSLMTEGVVLDILLRAFVSIILVGVVRHSITLWAFRRMAA